MIIKKDDYTHILEGFLSKITIQLFYCTEDSEPKQFGSGVLFKYLKRHFILTASHMFWGNGNIIPLSNLAIRKTEFLIKISGEMYRSNFNKNNSIEEEDDDNIDIAVIELSDELVGTIQNEYQFITINELGINHIFTEENKYYIFGYPTYRTAINNQKKIIKTAIFRSFTKLISDKRSKKAKLQPQQVGMNKVKIVDSQTKLKANKFEFNGISGCGLWYISDYDILNSNNLKIYLVGLMVYDKRKYNILKATKIEMVTELLRQVFKIYDIPQSTSINTTIDIN